MSKCISNQKYFAVNVFVNYRQVWWLTKIGTPWSVSSYSLLSYNGLIFDLRQSSKKLNLYNNLIIEKQKNVRIRVRSAYKTFNSDVNLWMWSLGFYSLVNDVFTRMCAIYILIWWQNVWYFRFGRMLIWYRSPFVRVEPRSRHNSFLGITSRADGLIFHFSDTPHHWISHNAC